MELNWSSLHKTLGDATRRSIVELLSGKETLSYTEMMAILRITNTGRLNYHLKELKDLISKDVEGRYRLTDKGKVAANMLRTFPERTPNGSSPLRTLVSLVMVVLGTSVIVSIVGLTGYFVAVGAVSTGIFDLGLGALLIIGLVLVAAGVLTWRNRMLHSL